MIKNLNTHLKTTQINLIISNIGSEWTIFVKLVYEFSVEKEKISIMEIQVLLILVLTIIYILYQTQLINKS